MNTHLIIGALISLLYFSLGVMMFTNSGERQNFYGYRTRQSLRNDDTWTEANVYAGRWMMVIGSLLIVSLLVFEIVFPEPGKFYPAIFSFIFLGSIATLLLTESRLRKLFFKDGKRKPYH